jgi:diguanylate cyclase (GGDEF)-like protein
VPFDADPVFAATKNLRTPYLAGATRTTTWTGSTRARPGVQLVGGACVPLLLADTTWGVLGFLHFGLHGWTPEEISALQAIASMLVQLQARIDAEERTEYIALHDDLTGLPNRRALLRELEIRLAANRETAILFFDLDRFKVMNDFLGHASGDRVLTTIADRIRTSIRPNDFAARLGGDEFVILVGDVGSEMEVAATAYRILGIIGEPIDFAGQEVSHTASIGIVLSKPGVKNGIELLGWADVALYAAKRQGRNQAVVFDEVLRESVSERSRTELTLREAIEGDGLRLHYQPEVDLRTGRLLAVEALVRWQHPTRGLLPASAFITVAEETGLVVDMGRWVFAEACRQLSVWRRDYPDLPLVVRVNMSPAQFVISGLVEFVENCLSVHRIPGERLCIEMTEHAVLQEPEQTARILRGFQALGCRGGHRRLRDGVRLVHRAQAPAGELPQARPDLRAGDRNRPERPGHRRSDHPTGPRPRPRHHCRGHRVPGHHRQAPRAGLPSWPGVPHVGADVRRGAGAGAAGGRGASDGVPHEWKGGPRVVGPVPVTLVDDMAERDIDIEVHREQRRRATPRALGLLDHARPDVDERGQHRLHLLGPRPLGPALPTHRRRGGAARRGARHPGLPAGAEEPRR